MLQGLIKDDHRSLLAKTVAFNQNKFPLLSSHVYKEHDNWLFRPVYDALLKETGQHCIDRKPTYYIERSKLKAQEKTPQVSNNRPDCLSQGSLVKEDSRPSHSKTKTSPKEPKEEYKNFKTKLNEKIEKLFNKFGIDSEPLCEVVQDKNKISGTLICPVTTCNKNMIKIGGRYKKNTFGVSEFNCFDTSYLIKHLYEHADAFEKEDSDASMRTIGRSADDIDKTSSSLHQPSSSRANLYSNPIKQLQEQVQSRIVNNSSSDSEDNGKHNPPLRPYIPSVMTIASKANVAATSVKQLKEKANNFTAKNSSSDSEDSQTSGSKADNPDPNKTIDLSINSNLSAEQESEQPLSQLDSLHASPAKSSSDHPNNEEMYGDKEINEYFSQTQPFSGNQVFDKNTEALPTSSKRRSGFENENYVYENKESKYTNIVEKVNPESPWVDDTNNSDSQQANKKSKTITKGKPVAKKEE